jgi:two-component system nitrate/nitrite response regulator NarL
MSEPTSAPEALLPIRVLAAGSSRMNTQLLADALAQDARFHLIAAEPMAAAILEAVTKENPDVVLLSQTLEDSPTRGFELARQLIATHPATRVVMLLDSSKRSSVLEAFRAGARGVFSRTESLKSLAKCIACAHSGQVWADSRELGYLLDAISRRTPKALADDGGFAILSKRQQDVVRCVAEGLSNREIAGRLHLTPHTVKNYLVRIFDKLGVSSRVELVLYALTWTRLPVSSRASTEPSNPRTSPADRRRDLARPSARRNPTK